MKTYLIILSLFVGGCCSVKPEFPRITPTPVSFDPPPKSVINLPVSVDFSTKVAEIDQKVSEQFPFPGGQDDCNLRYSYLVEKHGPLTIGFDPSATSQLNFATELRVGAGATFCALCKNFFGLRCVVPKVSASCGQGSEPLRRVKVSLNSPVDINPDYSLQANVRIKDLYFIDPCRVTFLNIDISGIIASQARRRIPLGAVNDKIATLSVKNQVLKFWDFLGSNIQLGDGLFLKVHPEQLSKTPTTGTGQVMQTSIGLVASPEISSDTTPPPSLPLPNLQPSTGSSGFNIFSDIKLDYKFLSTKLTDALKDQEVDVEGKKLKVKNIVTYATENRELIIKASFKGDLCGYLYIIGKPEYDSISREVKFTNLNYDAITNNFIVNLGLTAAWLLKPIVLQKLEEKAKVNIGNLIDQNTARLNSLLTKDYPNGISTQGSISSINIIPNNFQSLPQFFLIRMHAIGDLRVHLKMQPL